MHHSSFNIRANWLLHKRGGASEDYVKYLVSTFEVLMMEGFDVTTFKAPTQLLL